MNDNSNGPSLLGDTRKGMNLAMWLGNIWATSLEVFLHQWMGARYPGVAGVWVLVLVPLFSLAWPHDDLRPLMWFLGAYLVMCIGHRIEAVSRSKKGLNDAHSYYNGVPLLCLMFPKVSERTAKLYLEPLLVSFIGFMCVEWNAPLGWYLIWSGFFLRLVHHFADQSLKKQTLDLHDAMVGQQIVAESYRHQNSRSVR